MLNRFLLLLLFTLPAFFLSQAQVVEWINSTTIHTGTLSKGEIYTIHIPFKNKTSDTIYFDNIRPQCGCTIPIDWESIKIGPQDTGVLNLELEGLPIGYFNKKVKVYFNLQKKAEILFLEGIIEQP